MYIGIDQSYSGFGITFLTPDGFHETLVKGFDPKKMGQGVNRLLGVEDWLWNTMSERVSPNAVRHVCMEGYSNASKFGREKSGELGYAVKRTLYDYFADEGTAACWPTIVPPTSLKAYVVNGSAKKSEMLLHVYKKWGVEFKDDNAADSYAAARLARDIDRGTTDHKYEAAVIRKLHPHTERLAA